MLLSSVVSISANGRNIKLNPNPEADISDLESLYPYLNLDENYSILESRRTKSRLNNDIYYVKYQQYYKGVKVDGGTVFRPDGPIEPPVDPCGIAISPSFMQVTIYNEIDVDVSPSIQKEELDDIIGYPVDKHELVISHGLESECSYNLVWIMDYYSDGKYKVWVDAHSGGILKSIEYGIDNAKNSTQKISKPNSKNFENLAISGDSDIIISNINNCLPDWTNLNYYLMSTTPVCPVNEVETPREFQIQEMIETKMGHFADLGMEFNTSESPTSVHFAIWCEGNGAWNLNWSDFNSTTYVVFQDNHFDENGLPVADVLAHEFAHSYLNLFFNKVGGSSEANSLHEGISDIFGMYFESLCYDEDIDPIIGDNSAEVIRDLSNPPAECWDDIPSETGHAQGAFLGNWFWELVKIFPDVTIMNIVLDAIESLDNDNATIEDFYQGVINVVEQSIPDGLCSPIGKAIVNQFEEMCVYEPGDKCSSFNITAPYSFCEEDDFVCLRVNNLDGVHPYNDYSWQFPSGWEIVLGDGSPYNGNQSQYEGYFICLDFPDYSYYPKRFSICANQETDDFGIQSRCHTIELKDCDGDDPTCEEHHGFSPIISNTELNRSGQNFELDRFSTKSNTVVNVKVYTINGMLLYSGKGLSQEKKNSLFGNSVNILIIAEYNKQGILVNSRKEMRIEE